MFPLESHTDATGFAQLLMKAKLSGHLRFGKFLLPCVKGVNDSIQYNQQGIDLLANEHEYSFPLLEGNLQVSLQLYLNSAGHYRLFCYTRMGNTQGMVFSLNLTTEKESGSVIYLTQKIRFAEQYQGNPSLAQAHRRQKQAVFCQHLRRLGYDVTENNDLLLGIYDPARKKLVNTTAQDLLNDFLVVSVLKGHYQGNKGYQLEILPSFLLSEDAIAKPDDAVMSLPPRIVANKSKRAIPLSMRYRVLKAHDFKCVACGNGPAEGAKLQIDHKVPYSLGGLTELRNLQTLCADCNLSKSNKFCD
ncbi:HNH endonuclease [Hymenobacter jeollabukensis]|uniref:HNH endonuclease n=1 Tax=Hymenobacter jeollabukensis TaxID=2025313 RepID=A0A5R8WK04_9BACT|nr:HNH endonuclease signature motif containing protein [Hymenobacter jeollabukensis]TLM88962.1 HNH endonuclease [Hymenobacter jeollabukensis]